MHFQWTFVAAVLASSAAAEVFKFPLANGFPNVTTQALKDLEYQAGGPLPPSSSGKDTLPPQAALALAGLAYNEIFEVAFFTQLLQNITNNVQGYELGDDGDQILAALNSSQAQEELHAINANMGLMNSGNAVIEPCEYQFPVHNFTEAVEVADNYAMLLMAAIASVISDFGGSPEIVNLFSAVLGQEGQQDGYIRWVQSRVPNENPFLTSTTLTYVYNHIHQHFVVPGSCPQKLNIPVFATLTTPDHPPPANTTLTFHTDQHNVNSSLSISYMSGQMVPVTVPISNIKTDGNRTQFTAAFPYEYGDGFSRGLTVAALTCGSGKYTNVSQVSDATIAGPALIQVNYS